MSPQREMRVTPLRFGPYRLDGPVGPLYRNDDLVGLPPKALAVLWLLASHAGQVVPKARLLDTVWDDSVVSEGTLTTCLSRLRHALDEDPKRPRYIATVHRLGYRFAVPVMGAMAPHLTEIAAIPDSSISSRSQISVLREEESAMLLQVLLNQLGGRSEVQIAMGGQSRDGNSAGTFMELAETFAANRPIVLVFSSGGS